MEQKELKYSPQQIEQVLNLINSLALKDRLNFYNAQILMQITGILNSVFSKPQEHKEK